MTAPSVTCPSCGSVSYHPEDISEGYCGRCHAFTGGAAFRGVVHLAASCRDYLNGDRVATSLEPFGAVTCETCRAEALRLMVQR